jgi:hypothetical protein
MELLLKDANPMMLQRLASDPEMKSKQAENLKQLLAWRVRRVKKVWLTMK